MRALMLLLFWVCSLSCTAARAEIYRCVAQGKTVLTDRPCHAQAQPETVREPSVVTATDGEKRLAREFDRRVERERKARDAADREWARQHEADERDAARMRRAVEQRKVVRGMTPEQVRMLYGVPDRVETSTVKGSDIEQWFYEGGSGGKRVVTFRDGRVASAGSKDRKRKK